MAKVKIADLSTISGAVDSADLLVLVDASDTIDSAQGTTKKVTAVNLLGAGINATVGTLVVNSTLGVTGAATFVNLTTTGTTTLGDSGDATTINGTLGVTGVTTLTGNVGIGTAPAAPLHIESNVNSSQKIFIKNTTAGVAAITGISLFNDSGVTGAFNAYSSAYTTSVPNVANGATLAGNAHLGLSAFGSSGYVAVYTGASELERMRINSAGNVGIGHTAPGIVAGAAKYLTLATAQTNGAGYGSLEILGATTQNNVASKIDFINFRDNANYNIARITATVGTSSVDQGALGFWTNPSGGLVERMTISQAGAVTIGGTLGVTGATTLGDITTVSQTNLQLKGDLKNSSHSQIIFTDSDNRTDSYIRKSNYLYSGNWANSELLFGVRTSNTAGDAGIVNVLTLNGLYGAQFAGTLGVTGNITSTSTGNHNFSTVDYFIIGSTSTGTTSSGRLIVEVSDTVDGAIYVRNIAVGGRAIMATGTAELSTGTAWTNTSDKRIKQNITSIVNGLEKINQLNPVEFNYTQEYLDIHTELKDIRYNSFIADEYAEVFPNAINVGGNLEKIITKAVAEVKNEEGEIITEKIDEVKEIIHEKLLQYTPHDLIMYLVASVKELSAKVTALEAK